MKKTLTGVLAVGFAVTSVLTASGAVASPKDDGGSAGSSPAGSSARPSYTPPAYDPPPIDFGACTNATLVRVGSQCGLLTVPLDYNDPTGQKIQIAVSRKMHTTEKSQGIMLVNPGGPGGSGLIYSALQGSIPKDAGDSYDWIGFDPRGVGDSQPSLACDPNYFPPNRPDYVPTKAADEQFWLDKSKGYAQDCDAAGKAAVTGGKNLLDYLKTKDTVNDIESIRKALGKNKVNFYGFSYGTTIAQTYATLQPEHVRRFVLDGVTNPARSVYQSNLDQDVAFEKTENAFFAWVAKHNDVYPLGNTGAKVRAKWDSILAQTRVAPLDGLIGPDEWTDAFLSAGYYVYGWEDTADAFLAASRGDYAPVEQLYTDANGAPGPGSDNGFAIYLGTQCTDEPWPTSYDKIKADNERIYQKAPFETWANAWFNGPCLNWTGSTRKAKLDITDKGVPGMLLISETNDAATPFSGALEVRKRFSKSALIEGVGGTTHAGSLSGVGCTDNRIATYLATGHLPTRLAGNGSDVKCPPVPQPDPSSDTASRRSTATAGMPSELRSALMRAGSM